MITTLRTAAGDQCPTERTCPSLHRVEAHPDRLYFVVKREEDPEIVAAFTGRVAPDELLGWAPAELFPEIAS